MPWKTIYREKYKFTKNAHKTECDLAPKTLQEFVKLHNMRLLNLVIGSYLILKALRTKLIELVY